MNNQKGIAVVIIVITFAIIIGIGVLVYSYFINKKPAPSSSPSQTEKISKSDSNPLDTSSQTNPKDCLDADYTGCDNTADFMTWRDDGERNPTNANNAETDSSVPVYSK